MLVYRGDYTMSGGLVDTADNVTFSAAFGGLEPLPFPLIHFPHTNRTGLYQQLRDPNFG